MISASVGISVLIITVNRLCSVAKAIKSVLRQEKGDYSLEIVLLDNGSDTPITPKNLDDLGISPDSVRLIRSDKNLGVPGGRNRIAKEAEKEWMFFIDDDAFLGSDDILSKLADFLSSQQKLGILACNIIELRKPGIFYLPFSKKGLKKKDLSLPVPCAYFVGGAHVIRTDMFHRLGGYNEELFYMGEELDLSYRVIDDGYSIVYHPEMLVIHDKDSKPIVNSSKREYYLLRNKIFLNHAYLPLRYSLVSDVIWSINILRTGMPVQEIIRAIGDGLSMVAEKTILSESAIEYLKKYQGRLFF